MRRKYFGWAIAAAALLGPQAASAGDREIAGQIIERLKVNRSAGELKDFKFDMKVNDGVVLFRGSVTEDRQRELVLAAADGIEGVSEVVDQIAIKGETIAPNILSAGQMAATETMPGKIGAVAPVTLPVDPAFAADTAGNAAGFDMAGALATAAAEIMAESDESMVVDHDRDAVQTVANFELMTDQDIVNNVLADLGAAQKSGQLSGFGVDVQCNNGTVELTGRTKTAGQRDQILSIVSNSAGVNAVRERITVLGQTQVATAGPTPMLDPPVQTASVRPMPAQTQQAATPMHPQHAQPMHHPAAQPLVQAAPYRMNHGGVPAQNASHGGSYGSPIGGVSGTPVPIAPYAAQGAPRYDTPNLPNYAWPGYAAHPNYAAVTYPQQYSPSAWPYIGPFYPYPQVPLGWRKVSLEWDDGWWFLDFTDRDY